MRAAFLSALLLAINPPVSAQQETPIDYKDVEGVWVRAFEGFDVEPSASDCDSIKNELALTIDGRAIYGKSFDCAIKTVDVYYQTKVFAYTNCSIDGDSILRRYAFSMIDGLLYVNLTDFSPGEPRRELASSESVYRRSRCNNAG